MVRQNTVINNLKKGFMKKCYIFHSWKTISDDGTTKYQECKDCKERRFKQRPGTLKTINQQWLDHKTNQI